MTYHLSLQQKNTQNLKQTQQLMMTPHMQQAIKLLQKPVLELSALIELELERNPLLEYEENVDDQDDDIERIEELNIDKAKECEQESDEEINFDDNDFEILKRLDEDFRDYFDETESHHYQKTQENEKLQRFLESTIIDKASLYDYLMQQAHEVFSEKGTLDAAEMIIGELDENGFLSTEINEIAALNSIDPALLESVLKAIQTFDPPGVGARSLRESLLIQLKLQKLENTLAYELIEKNYEDLLHNRVRAMTANLHCDPAEIKHAIATHIRKFDLHPGQLYNNSPNQSITPDLSIRSDENNELIVEVHDETVPTLRINPHYLKMLNNPELPSETKQFIQQKLLSAKWLLKNLYQRNDTIRRIADCIAREQKNYFTHPDGKLRPMTMKKIAEELDLHESTIARAVANKYISCDRGTVAMRALFTNAYETAQGKAISSETVRDVLKKLIDNEDKQRPLSDQALSKLLQTKGISCARRTVAKYRVEMQIGNALQRRDYT